jgi:hypothetical protein
MRSQIKKIICHVGHGKTGTSYIQSALQLNSDLLQELGISYPLAPDYLAAERGDITSGNGRCLFSRDFCVNGTVLLSSEFLFHELANEEKLKKYLLSHGVDVEVVLYTRNIFDFLTSIWGQAVKRGGLTQTLDEYLVSKSDPHHSRVGDWISLSKKYGFCLKVLNYSEHRSGLLESFVTSALGANAMANLHNFTLPKRKVVNRSLTKSEYALQIEFNKHFAGTNLFVSDAWVNSLSDIPAEIPNISPIAYEEVVRWMTPIVRKINENLPHEEKLRIESFQEVLSFSRQKVQGELSFSQSQIQVLVQGICQKMLQDSQEIKRLKQKIQERKSNKWWKVLTQLQRAKSAAKKLILFK